MSELKYWTKIGGGQLKFVYMLVDYFFFFSGRGHGPQGATWLRPWQQVWVVSKSLVFVSILAFSSILCVHCHFLKKFHIQYHFFTIYVLYTQKFEFYIILTVTMLTERPDFHNKHQTQTISKPLIQKHLPRLNIPFTNKNTVAKLTFNLYTFMHKNNPTSIQSGILIYRAWSSSQGGRERAREREWDQD